MNEGKNIQTINFPQLDEMDSAIACKSIDSFYYKVARMSSTEPHLVLHHKEHQKKGFRKKHVIVARLSLEKGSFQAEEVNWSFLTALQKTLKTLLRGFKSKHGRK